jgi:hypothetical protein
MGMTRTRTDYIVTINDKGDCVQVTVTREGVSCYISSDRLGMSKTFHYSDELSIRSWLSEHAIRVVRIVRC